MCCFASLKKYGALLSVLCCFSVLLLTLIPNFAGDNFNQNAFILLPIYGAGALCFILISPYRPNVKRRDHGVARGLAIAVALALLNPKWYGEDWLEPLQFCLFSLSSWCAWFGYGYSKRTVAEGRAGHYCTSSAW